MTSIDEVVAQAVQRSRLAEAVLHGDHQWEMSWGPHVVPAGRLREGVLALVAAFPATCYLERPRPLLGLLRDGELVAVRPVPDPGDEGFSVAWEFLAERVPA
jgi:hypothetical protein